MKKLVTMLVVALMSALLIGCSKASKYESLFREFAAELEKAGAPKISEEEIKAAVEAFKKVSAEEQDKLLKEFEEMLKKKDEKK